jgi:hypothetical protein
MMSTLPTLASALLILGLIGRAIKVIPARILIEEVQTSAAF